ncbi:MAG: hypothetical protein IGS38_23120 [Synechococcales cyanobacterium M58_A2018_015]|nr:hypothetical protein [Synechococcales cyanobacterium M58_A2018_015]
MKRALMVVAICLLMLINLAVTSVAQAQSLVAIDIPGLELTSQQQDFLNQLETKILPQLENILTPEQKQQLQAALSEGGLNLRKIVQSLSLTPDQKDQLSAVFKSLPKDDLFADLTPEQKRQFFLQKKQYFMPTAEEISERISTKMKLKEDMMGTKNGFAPTAEEIGERISAKMKLFKSKLEAKMAE